MYIVCISLYKTMPLLFSAKSYQQTSHSLPLTARLGGVYWISKSGLCFAPVIVLVYVIPWYIAPHYDDTPLYFFIFIQPCMIYNLHANPVYCIASNCHQVRWLRWGHPSLFHRATSLLSWYKILCVRDISCILIWMEIINMFPCMHNLGCTVVLIDKSLWF